MLKSTLFVVFMIVVVIVKIQYGSQDKEIVFEDRNGLWCGCLVDDNTPTLDQCDSVSEPVVITVSTCN